MSARMMVVGSSGGGGGDGGGGAVGPFGVQLGPGLVWVPNEDGTRRFLAVRVSEEPQPQQQVEEEDGRGKESGRLNRLLWACNTAVAEFGFGGLYVSEGQEREEADRSDFFHFSLAWCLASQLKGREVSQGVLDEVWANVEADEVRNLTILVDAVLVKIGNTVHRIPLGAAIRKGAEKHGILG